MKFSKSLIPTQRQAPSDAEVISHKLLVRAGMIRKLAAGIYEFLPLGFKSLKKVENIVRNELDNAGCQEVLLPHLVPSELWQESGRWQKYGKELLRIQDRHERDYCFGPTHEETICDMVRFAISSYKSFPFNLYQIQTKFRDEIRPRFGLMRGREFSMKDGYSFHTSEDDLDREYQHMYETYLKIFKLCGLECRSVEADTGAIGGSSSHEFMVLADTGEDVIASCDSCSYAANLEKATFFSGRKLKVEGRKSGSEENMQDVSTPGLKSIGEVSGFLKIKPGQMIKTLVYKADELYLIACLAGDREVSEVKLGHYANGDELRLATDEEVMNLTGVSVGFLGPVGLADRIRAKNSKAEFKILYDHSVLGIDGAVTGANKADYHTVNVGLKRDLKINEEGSLLSLADFSNVVEGDICPSCQKGILSLMRGIEVGHIFKLGKRYSEPMKVNYLDQNGKEQYAIMGTYGLGIGRTMAASVEQSHDDKGIIWPRALAPYEVHLINLDKKEDIVSATEKLYHSMRESGLDVLWDDRDERAGVKFNDADLIGIPLQVVIGKRGLEKGSFEYKIRKSGDKGDMPIEGAVDKIFKLLETL